MTSARRFEVFPEDMGFLHIASIAPTGWQAFGDLIAE